MKRIKTNAIAFDSIPTRTTTMKLSRKTLANIGYDYEIADNGDIEFLFTGVIDSRRQEAMQSIAATIEVLGYEGRFQKPL